MQIYLIHAGNFDYINELYNPIKTSELYKKHQLIFPHETTEKNSKIIIQQSDLVLAEVSYPSTGSGIELGWADTFHIPILCVYRKDKHFSSALKYITDQFIAYENPQDLVFKLERWLNARIVVSSDLI